MGCEKKYPHKKGAHDEKVYAVEKEVKVDKDHVDIETRVALIQALIPLGLEAVMDVLQDQVRELAGSRYARKDAEQSVRRWGKQKGWVYLADQKLPVEVPRMRDVAAGV